MTYHIIVSIKHYVQSYFVVILLTKEGNVIQTGKNRVHTGDYRLAHIACFVRSGSTQCGSGSTMGVIHRTSHDKAKVMYIVKDLCWLLVSELIGENKMKRLELKIVSLLRIFNSLSLCGK